MRPRKTVKAAVTVRLSEVLEIDLENRFGGPLEIEEVPFLSLKFEGSEPAPPLRRPMTSEVFRKTLRPGESVPLLGPGPFAFEGEWTPT